MAYKKAFLVRRDEPETLSLLYYVLLAEVLLLIHHINRIAFEECLDDGDKIGLSKEKQKKT